MSPLAVLVCGSAIAFLGFGVRSGFALFLQPMSLDFGWGREVFSLAMAIQNLIWGALSPFAGGIADRYGAGRVLAGCGVLYVAGLVAMAFVATPFGLHLSAGFLIGLALSGASFAIVLAAIARVTPPEKRSMAFGIATAAGSFGQFVMLPVTQFLISRFQWQMALLELALLVALIVPLAAALRGRPAAAADTGQSLGAALREAGRDRSFHLIFWGYFVCGFQTLMFTVHLPAFVTDAGLAAEHGMMALALIGLFNMAGSVATGWLGQRYSKKRLLALVYFGRGALILYCLVLVPLTPLNLYIFAMVMGLTWFSTLPLANGLIAQIFGLRYMATLAGILFFGHQLGSFLGIWLAGYIYDATGAYTGVFIIATGLGVLAALISLPVNEKPLGGRPAIATA